MAQFRVFVFCLLLAFTALIFQPQSSLLAQTAPWSKRWGSAQAYESGRGVGLDCDGNIYIGGYTLGFGAGNRDFLLLKYNSSGALQWARTWGGIANEYGYGLSVNSTGDCIIVGRSNSFTASYDATIAKFDSAGTLIWARTWGGISSNDFATGVSQDLQGNIYVAGCTDGEGGIGAGGYDIFILKYDAAGNQLWAKTWGGPSQEWGWQNFAPDIVSDADGNAFITAGTFSFGSHPGINEDVLILKYDSGGTLQWARTWGRESVHEEGQSIAVDSTGNIYIAGISNSLSYGYGATSDDNAFMLSLTPSGTTRWCREFDSGSLDDFQTIDIDQKGNIYAAGAIFKGNQYDALIVKWNSSGTAGWFRTFGDDGFELAYSGVVSKFNFYLTGYDSGTTPPSLEDFASMTTVTLDFIMTVPANGMETAPSVAISSPSGTVGSPVGEEAGSASVDVMLFDVRENAPPSPPTPVSPAAGSHNVPKSPMLSAVYNDPDGDPIDDSEWRVCRDVASKLVVYRAIGGAATMHRLTKPLNGQTGYYWSCRFKDNHGNWSSWSPAVHFFTGGLPAGRQ